MVVMSEDRVSVTIDRGVAEVRLTRPQRRNALDRAMFRAIAEAGARLKTERGVRAVVLSGEGPSFCAGLDFGALAQLAESTPDSLDAASFGNTAQNVAWVWQELPMPVIAAVHGHAFGAGLQIALAADIRIVHPDTELSVREGFWGLVPDMTGTLTLSWLVRPDVAKELTFTARIFDAREAMSLGLVTKLSDTPREAALAMAAEIAERSPDAVRSAKALFARLLGAAPEKQFAAERAAQSSLIGTPNQIEAVAAGLEKRAPQFVDPEPG